jgi:hypothetical protein
VGGNGETATGYQALYRDRDGVSNTADGVEALYNNYGAGANTAVGAWALYGNTSGEFNTGVGNMALYSNTTGSYNTALGANSFGSGGGNSNTAIGTSTLFSLQGGYNTATGVGALHGEYIANHFDTGYNNTADGVSALAQDGSGYGNTASGLQALYNNRGGYRNTAAGTVALYDETEGHYNIGIGWGAGENISTGSYNIDIGAFGSSTDQNTIRIGTQGTQTGTYIAGISGEVVTGADVVVSSSGKLGIVGSSARYKRDIHDMGTASSGLMRLRPVTFRYKNDPRGTLEYGLVAEEVARVYPSLVTYGPDGKLQSVRYLQFTALLLDELQKQDHQLAAQQREIDGLKQQNASNTGLSERLAALEQEVRTANPGRFRSLAKK